MCSNTNPSLIGYLIDHDADPIMQDDEGRDAMDHTPFDAEYVKGMIRNKSGKSMTSIRFMRNHSYFGHRFFQKN